MATSTTPVMLSTYSTFAHVSPPSVLRYRPRSTLGPQRCPMAATNTISGFVGSSAMRPISFVARRPMWRHVRPPSVDL
jgi:hypothetical protein